MSKPLRSGYRVSLDIGGPETEALERELEKFYGVPHARVFNSGTAALHAALVASGVPSSLPTVRVPVYSMSASATSVIHAGGQVLFHDIADDYCIDTLGEHGANMLVHLFGHHRQVERGIQGSIIHDCAQSPTIRPDPERSYDIWCFSLNQHKPVSCGEGGYALTFKKHLADGMHAARNHGECVRPDILGHNLRMTEMQAQTAREEFRQLDERITARRFWAAEMQERYDLPPDPGNIDWFLYPVRVKRNREEFAKRIPGARVGYHKLIPDLPWFAAHGYGGEFHNARLIESELVVIDPEAYNL